MTVNEFLADLLMLMHACFSMFLVVGLGLIFIGMILGWHWTRRRWFRLLHLVVTLFVVARVWIGLPCPFSVGEDNLRRQTTAACPMGNSFHEILHRLAFRGKDPNRFVQSTTLFGVLALTIFVLNGYARPAAGEIRGKHNDARS